VGALLVDRIEGDHPTVVGLPVAAVAQALRDLGLDALGGS
jgi:predicted house-cleaning NTP pyrophosphatase (Maf/HAM1 superfamily)